MSCHSSTHEVDLPKTLVARFKRDVARGAVRVAGERRAHSAFWELSRRSSGSSESPPGTIGKRTRSGAADEFRAHGTSLLVPLSSTQRHR